MNQSEASGVSLSTSQFTLPKVSFLCVNFSLAGNPPNSMFYNNNEDNQTSLRSNSDIFHLLMLNNDVI